MTVIQPLVTIIVPSFNQCQYLPATLDSILSQDYRPLEVWVVDGGSTDQSIDVLHDYAARYPEINWLSEKDSGPADAVNKGLARARGAICGIQSSDDIYLPGAIREGVEALLNNPQVAIAYGEGYPMDEHGLQLLPAWRWLPYSYENFLCGSTFILQTSAFFRTEVGREVGGWRPDYFVCDVDFWLRILHHHEAIKLDRVWSAYRRHATQRNTQTRKIFESYWRMIEESPEIKAAPRRIRRAADAGRRMEVQHYNPTGSRLYRSYQVIRALLIYPPSWHTLRNPGLLVPGGATMVKGLRRLFR